MRVKKMNHLSENSKQALIQKALNPSAHKMNIRELARLNNVGYSTLQKWISCYRKSVDISGRFSGRNKALSQAEKFQHLLETAALDEAAVGAYCRERGIYSFQLKEWKEAFMTEKPIEKKQAEFLELKTLRSENKMLKQELRRKDGALAEASALLILKKKPD